MTAQAGRRTLVRRLGQVVGWALLVGAVVLGWPSSMGGCTTLTIVTGHSMEPTLHPGDLAVTRCGNPQVGDVVAYRPFADKSPVVIHRIIGGDPVAGWELQGDNNHFIDPFKPVAGQVTGVMVAAVPGLGGVMSFFTSPLMWVSLLLLAAAFALWPEARPTTSSSAS
ncbi:S24/S26 family peptidase [Propionicimonas sp.]|uniref:S24/S26 family peptidase n=1 Tax=Propionicimonas sp. TaxID=1955623 RepID=UPI0039E31AD9